LTDPRPRARVSLVYTKLPTRTLGALVRHGEAGAVAHVRKAMAKNGGAVAPAARALGVSRKALSGWLDLPHLQDVVRLDRAGAARRARARKE
jgi:hypothetical protein